MRAPGPEPAPPDVDYGAFVEAQAHSWQRHSQERLRWWRDYLAGCRPVLDVPGDLPGAGPTGPGRVRRFAVEPRAAAAVRDLCRTSGTTLFVTMAAAYATVLHHRTGRDDLLIGIPLSHRPRSAYHELIGMFVNTVVLRARFAPDTDFPALLRDTRAGMLGALEHQDVPLSAVVYVTGTARDPGHHPLFQVMFDLHSFPPDELRLPGIEVRALDGGPVSLNSLEVPGQEAKFDLTLTVEDTGEAMLGALEYRTDRYSAAWADGFVGDLLAVLDQAVAVPARPLRDLALSRPGESIAHGPAVPVPETTVHALISEHARTRPDAVAVVDGAYRLTYGALERTASELAVRLRAAGVGPGVTVAVLADRSAGLIVDLLAVLKAGGTYLPLDPRHPAGRMRAMVRDGGAQLLLVRRNAGLGSDPGELGLDAGEDWGPDHRLIRPAGPGQPVTDGRDGPHGTAYLLFTSGSTGKPKAVAVSHRALINAHLGWQASYSIAPTDAVAQLAGPAFDVFSGELVRALCSGARLVIVRDDVVVDPARLSALLRAEAVTIAEFVPSVLRRCSTSAASRRRCDSLRWGWSPGPRRTSSAWCRCCHPAPR